MWEIENLHEKLNKLPEPARSYATSLKSAQVNSQIFNVAQVPIDKWPGLTLLIAGIIVKEIDMTDLENKIKNYLELDEKKSSQLTIEIVGSRLLIFDDWLSGEPEKYLTDKSVSPSRFAAIIAEQQLAISKEAEFYKEQSKEKKDYVFEVKKESSFDDVLDQENEEIINTDKSEETEYDIKEEKRKILKTLSHNLVPILKSDDKEVLYQFNYSFVLLWGSDEKFSLEASPALLANQEKISQANLIIDGEEKKATISELLKGFIKKYGLEANDLNIAEYLSSHDVNLLSDKEKVIALRILKFHNNINNLDKYLDSDLENVPDGFEVLSPPASVAKENNNQVTTNEKKAALKEEGVKVGDSKKERTIETPKVINETKEKDGVTPPSLKDTRSAEQLLQPETSSLANELEKMLQDYTEGSLEYKTILQEIKRLKSSK